MEIYYIIINVAYYMVRALIVAIFRDAFFEVYIYIYLYKYIYITSLKMATISGQNM